MSRTHLFVGGGAAFGEAVLGLRIADELALRGDRVVVLAPDGTMLLNDRPGLEKLTIPAAALERGVDQLIVDVAKKERADSIVLLDLTYIYTWLLAQGCDEGFAARAPAPLLALDAWNVAEAGFLWDFIGAPRKYSAHALDVTRRLIPVPFAKPTGPGGRYRALPEATAVDPDERTELRADLGVGEDERLVLLTSARWQHLVQLHDDAKRLAASFPRLLELLLARTGPRLRVAHVGPEPFTMSSLGERYTWLSPRSTTRFAKLLASVDLLVSFNFTATTVASAVAHGVPVLLGVNSREGKAKDVLERLPRPPSDPVRRWIEGAAPLSPFRVWPAGLWRTLASSARDNPYSSAMRTVEVLDEDAFVGGVNDLLFDPAARAEASARQEAYRTLVSKLPSAATLVEGYLAR